MNVFSAFFIQGGIFMSFERKILAAFETLAINKANCLFFTLSV